MEDERSGRSIPNSHLPKGDHIRAALCFLRHTVRSYEHRLGALFAGHSWLVEHIARAVSHLGRLHTTVLGKVVVNPYINDPQAEAILPCQHTTSSSARDEVDALLPGYLWRADAHPLRHDAVIRCHHEEDWVHQLRGYRVLNHAYLVGDAL